jgi:hypothetical protein
LWLGFVWEESPYRRRDLVLHNMANGGAELATRVWYSLDRRLPDEEIHVMEPVRGGLFLLEGRGGAVLETPQATPPQDGWLVIWHQGQLDPNGLIGQPASVLDLSRFEAKAVIAPRIIAAVFTEDALRGWLVLLAPPGDAGGPGASRRLKGGGALWPRPCTLCGLAQPGAQMTENGLAPTLDGDTLAASTLLAALAAPTPAVVINDARSGGRSVDPIPLAPTPARVVSHALSLTENGPRDAWQVVSRMVIENPTASPLRLRLALPEERPYAEADASGWAGRFQDLTAP